MTTINTKLLKGLLNSKVTIKELEKFREDFKALDDKSFIGKGWLLDTKQIPPLTKNKKNIIAFVEKYNEFIIILEKNEILSACTTGFDIDYHWEDIYKKALINIKDSSKAIKLIDTLESKGYKDISFVEENEFSKTFYEKINKKYNKDEYEIEYYFSNGKKQYLAQYYTDYYPIIFENANIVLIYKEGNFFSNENRVYLNTFNIDINTIKFPKNTKEILESINEKEIKKFNLMCENLRNLEKEKESLIKNIKTLEKLIEIKELKDFHKKILQDTREKIKELEKVKESIIENYISLGYKKDFLEKNLEHLKNAEWNASLHID